MHATMPPHADDGTGRCGAPLGYCPAYGIQTTVVRTGCAAQPPSPPANCSAAPAPVASVLPINGGPQMRADGALDGCLVTVVVPVP